MTLRKQLAELGELRFLRLLRHCVDRIFFGGEGAAEGEVDVGIGAVLALLAGPGMFISLGLAAKYSTLSHYLTGNHSFDAYRASLPDEYFLITLSMVVAGAVAIWKWDSLLPDRRDYQNLAHLPISARNLFLANLIALLLLAVVLSLDINAASSVLFPLVVCWNSKSFSYLGIFLGTNLLSVAMAAAFGFLGVLSILGVLMAFLPYRVFRKLSMYVRSGLLIAFVALLLASFSEPRRLASLAESRRAWMRVPPPAWFAALCQSWRGLGSPVFSALSRAALIGSGVAFVVAMGAYALSYRRSFLKSAETMVVLPAGGGFFARGGFRIADWAMLRGPVQRGGYRFAMKVLFRSEAHALTWIGFTAVGVMIVSDELLSLSAKTAHPGGFPSIGILGMPLLLMYFLMFGLRLTFEMPGPLRANWVFRLGIDPATQEYTALAKRVMLTFELPLLVGCFAAFARYWGWQIALLHTTIVSAMTMLLIETLLLRFRKIPFTCTAPPFKDTTIVSFILYLLGLNAFSAIVPTMEYQAHADGSAYGYLIVVLLAAWAAILYASRANLNELQRKLIFEDTIAPVLETMDLTFRR